MYSEFEEKFGVLSEVHFSHTLYRFEAQEVRSQMLQMV